MARRAQGLDGWGRRVFLWLSLCGALPLAACGTKGFSLDAAAPDRTAVTGSIPPRAPSELSDEATVRNAVSSAIVEEVGEDGIGWANVGTGSRGTIRDVSERKETGRLCRSFVTTLESFDGVHLYSGEACLDNGAQWAMHRFRRAE